MAKKKNNTLILLGVGAAVYFLTKPANAEDEQDLFLAGASGGVQQDLAGETGLTKKQIGYISQFDNSLTPTTVETFDFNGVKQNIVTTDISNLAAIESAQGFSTFASTPTDIYYKQNGDFVGGSSFITQQSITAAEAARRYNNRDDIIKAPSSGGSGSSKKKSKNNNVESISTSKDKVVRDYENENKVSTTKTKKEIQKENTKKSTSSFFKSIGL